MATTKLQLEKDVQWAIGTNIWSLKVCGVWRNENYNQWHETFSNMVVPIYVSITAFFVLFPQACALVKVWGNMTLVVENLVSLLPFSATMCKMVTMWYKKEAIIRMMNFIREDWLKLETKGEREVMIKYAQISRLITLAGYLLISAMLVVYHGPVICFGIVLRSLSNITDTGSRPVALQSIYFFEVYEKPAIYQFVVVGQTVSCTIACFCYQTAVALFVAIVLHVGSQLENLSVRIGRMLKNDMEVSNNFQNSLSLNIKEHQRLIRFTNMIEDTFSIMLLMIFPAFTIIFCVQGFQLIDTISGAVEGTMVQVVFYILYMLFTSSVVFMYTSVGQVLVAQSEEIENAAYKCEWYNLRPKEAAQLIVILIRAQRPLQLTAGSFVPLTLTTFAGMLKTTTGYMSCLLAVHE